MINQKLLAEINKYVNTSPNKEVCGIIVSEKRKHTFIPCHNVAQGENEFIIDPLEYAEIYDKYKIYAIVHSHVNSNPKPSQADLISIEQHKIPFLIVNYPLNTYTWTEPTGYEAPYVGRPFVHGITDCYAIWRDYYQRELNIQMKDYYRQKEWWIKGDNLYLDYYKEAGFVEVETPQKHDIILMQVGSPVPNHCAVFLENNIILHHVMGRLSTHDVYGGYWRKITNLILRHHSLC